MQWVHFTEAAYRTMSTHKVFLACVLPLVLAACGGGSGSPENPTRLIGTANSAPAESFTASNASGEVATWSAGGKIDTSNPFFRPLNNGRSCASCHNPRDAWSLTPSTAASLFASSNGNDPLFLPHDGANSPSADVSTPTAKNRAYSLLLSRGLIRIGLPLPQGEFDLLAADDPYGYASATELSLFRRPLPATNLSLVADVMWDGRETPLDPSSSLCVLRTGACYVSTRASLLSQALNASRSHQQMVAGLTQADLEAIVKFEMGLFTAQKTSFAAGNLSGAGARGGPGLLTQTGFWFGRNSFDSGDYRSGAPFSTRVFTAFESWNSDGPLADPDTPADRVAAVTAARQSVARGEAIFNGRPMFINSVPGMRAASVRGSCASCHNMPETGSSSIPLLVNIGTADAARRSADLPLYTLRNRITGEQVQVTDPGAAMQSGRWEDIGKFKVPGLRALAARAPYFHDGSAATLADVVQFYNERFQMSLSQQDRDDLVAFLSSL